MKAWFIFNPTNEDPRPSSPIGGLIFPHKSVGRTSLNFPILNYDFSGKMKLKVYDERHFNNLPEILKEVANRNSSGLEVKLKEKDFQIY